MSFVKKQKIDWCGNVMNEIDIASEKLLLEFSNNENITKSVNTIREVILAEVKEIECFNLSNEMKKYVYFIPVNNIVIDSSFGGYDKIDNLLGNLLILNQDYSHLFKNLKHVMDLRKPETLSIAEVIKKKKKFIFYNVSTFQDRIHSEILGNLIKSKNETNIIIDLSKPLENILESFEFTCQTNENNDCVSELVNVNKVIMLTVNVEQINTITDDFFSIFKNLQKLVLYPISLVVIKEENFSTLKNLTHLIIDKCEFYFDNSEDNNLKTIEKNAFLGLKNLKSLILVNNGIQEINKDMFNGLDNLVTLSIAENCLKIVEKDTFINLKNLQNLNLSQNYIRKLENGCLNGLDELVTIKLKDQYNDQMQIETNVFDSCDKLECLNLYECKIENLNDLIFRHAVSLKVLGISGQNLDDNSSFIHQFTNLKCLVIKKIDAEHCLKFNCFNQLNAIVLGFDRFQSFGKIMYNIKALNIVISIFDIFDSEIFDKFENLEYLGLFFSNVNIFEKLKEKHLEKLKNLKYLKIQLFDCNFSNFTQLQHIFVNKIEFCRQIFESKNFEYKYFYEENDIGTYCDLYAEFKLCESSEVFYKKDLEFSSQSIEFLMDELKFEF
ncbi:unnamed protein product [Brachionus calyciflorus]|uniref:Uncharacterized protein n=1 Tax=Brachionus calyciflorus TaxID=104777 RepID=A0A813W5P1_9BILA|nr:unnamed protein product [Brachionus calyciflorus]